MKKINEFFVIEGNLQSQVIYYGAYGVGFIGSLIAAIHWI